MKKASSFIFLLFFSPALLAGTAINCTEAYKNGELTGDTMSVCAEQTDRHLNENYQTLIKSFGNTDKEKVKLLKVSQRAWIKLRDAQCELAGRAVATHVAENMLACEIMLTQKRVDELERMEEREFY